MKNITKRRFSGELLDNCKLHEIKEYKIDNLDKYKSGELYKIKLKEKAYYYDYLVNENSLYAVELLYNDDIVLLLEDDLFYYFLFIVRLEQRYDNLYVPFVKVLVNDKVRFIDLFYVDFNRIS